LVNKLIIDRVTGFMTEILVIFEGDRVFLGN